jgi:hypothetical protein
MRASGANKRVKQPKNQQLHPKPAKRADAVGREIHDVPIAPGIALPDFQRAAEQTAKVGRLSGQFRPSLSAEDLARIASGKETEEIAPAALSTYPRR